MDNNFWLKKWDSKEIGFHLPEYHPLLLKYYTQIFSEQSAIFVPLCGKSKDMIFLESQGLNVLGCELSQIAAEEFFSESQNLRGDCPTLKIEVENQSLLTRYHSSKINILVGDIFNLDSTLLTEITCIYDRAALIALPKELRLKYANHLRVLLPKAKMLLITLDYDQSKMSGPPFSVNKTELGSLFSFAKIKELQRTNIIDDEPHFKKKGLTSFNQTAYFIEW